MVREACDLCGARLYESEPTCRECGAPRQGEGTPSGTSHSGSGAAYVREGDTLVEAAVPLAETSTTIDGYDQAPTSVAGGVAMSAESTAATIPPATAGTVPPSADLEFGYDEPVPSSSGKWIVGGAVLLAAAGAAFFIFSGDAEEPPGDPTAQAATPPADEPPAAGVGAPAGSPNESPVSCEGADALVGRWTFTTEVTTALSVARLGIRGFYEMQVSVDGCTIEAEVRKTGYTGKSYGTRHVRRATAKLAPTADDPPRFTGTFELRSKSQRGSDLEFEFTVAEDVLQGVYRQRGESWTSSGLSGFLIGERGSTRPRHPSLHQEPCWAQCEVACGFARREGDEALAEQVSACASSCAADPEASARCGGVDALPPAFALDLEGPHRRLSGLCKALGAAKKKSRCDLDAPLMLGSKKTMPPSLEDDEVGVGFVSAHLMVTRPKARGALAVRLALETKQGWFASAPLLPPGSGLTDVGLFGRDLGEGERRYVTGFVTAGEAARLMLCDAPDGQPGCALIEPKDGQFAVPLPGAVLALVSGSDATLYGL